MTTITFNIQRTLDREDIGAPEFDHVYRLTTLERPDGTLEGYVTASHADSRPWGFAPEVYNDDERDVTLPDGWQALTGNTGQYGYSGAVMHPSELWSQCHVDDLVAAGDNPDHLDVYFAVVEVIDLDDPEAVVGWAVVYTLGHEVIRP